MAVLVVVGLFISPLVQAASTQMLNPALFIQVAQSSDASTASGAGKAVDNANATFSLTANLPGSYWSAALGHPYPLDRLELVNRAAPADMEMEGLNLVLYNLDDQPVFQMRLANPGSGGTNVIVLPADLRARSIWIGLPASQTNGAGNYRVGLAEVRLFGDPSIPYAPASVAGPTNQVKLYQSSDYSTSYPPDNAADNNPASFTHTANLADSFWLADLGKDYPIDRVELVNRADCCSARLSGLVLRILDGASNTTATATLKDPGLGGLWTYAAPAGTVGRYIRVGLENGQKNADGNYYVTLAEARVFSGTTNLLTTSSSPVAITHNLASGKPCYMMRLTASLPPASNANDDNYSTDTRTTQQSVDAYWEVDLGALYALYSVRVIGASGIGYRLTNTFVRLFNGAHDSVQAQRLRGTPDVFDADLNGPILARYVRIGLENKQRTDPAGGIEWYIGMREVEVFGRPANEVGILDFSASTQKVAATQPLTLSWNSEGVRRLEIHPDIGSVGAHTEAAGRGSLILTPPRSTEYLLIATNSVDVFTRALAVEVDSVPLTVQLSEIVADNRYSLRDGFGEAPDWIELRNPSDQAISLAGYSLSDDLAKPRKWVFPAVAIGPHSNLVVCASGRVTGIDAAGYWHTNFRLSKAGGLLLLTGPDGFTTVDVLAGYPPLDADLAYGRNLDGQWCYLEPTPGAINRAPTYTGWLRPLTFSQARGFCQTPFTLTINNPNPGAQVYYSLDGSAPALPYANGIYIADSKAVRAQVVQAGYKAPRIQTFTYLFLDKVITSSVMKTTITKDTRYASRIKPGLLSLPSISLVLPGQPEYQEKEGSVEILWPDGSKPVQANAEIMRFGSSWQDFAKRSIRAKFRSRLGAAKLSAPLFNGFDHGVPVRTSFDELEFRSGSQDMVDRGFYVAGRFVEDSMLDMGSLNPHGRYVHVYLNGVYWGQYDAREPLVDHFLADYLGGSPEQYNIVRGNDNVGDSFIPGTPDPPNVQAWTRVVSLANSYQKVRPYLDVSNLIDFMLLWFYGNCESEYRAAGPLEAGSGFKFWMADADGFLRTSASGLDRSSNPGPAGLFGALVAEADSDFKTLVADRIYRHCYNGGALTLARNTARLNARMQEIHDSLVVECARWLYRTPANWEAAAADIRASLFPSRTSQLLSQMRARGLFPSFLPPAFNQYGGLVTNGFQPQLVSTNGVIYYTLDGSDPRLPGGAVSPNALRWTPGTVSITQDLSVCARVRAPSGQWSALAQPRFLLIPRQAPTARDLLVTEIHYHPTDGASCEFIELWNAGTNLLDLSGVNLTNAVRFTFPYGYLLPANSFAIVVKNVDAFAQRYQDSASPWYWSGINVAGEWVGNLDNQGETLSLVASNGLALAVIPYHAGGDWPKGADGQGSSLELRGLPPGMDSDQQARAYLADPLNWTASSIYHGSPGRFDTYVKSVRINEIRSHSNMAGDWVELLNLGSEPVDLAHCGLTDTIDQPQRWLFPSNTVIQPGQYMIVQAAQLGYGFNALGDSAILLKLSGTNVLRILDRADFPAAALNESLGLYLRSDGEMDFTELSLNTPGSANALPRIGPVVISEIMSSPAAGQAQFIVLANITSMPVNLFDPVHPTNVWRLEGVGNLNFPTNMVLPAYGSVVICSTNPADFRAQYGVSSSKPAMGPWEGALDEQGETLVVWRPGDPQPDGTVPYYRVDHVTFRAAPPWPSISAGLSLQRIPLSAYGNDPIHWQAGPTAVRLPEPFEITAQVRDGAVYLMFPALLGETYRVEYNDSLGASDWRVLQQIVGASTNRISLSDPPVSPSGRRYYRVLWLR